MTFGLSGASGGGKTTLAKGIADAMGIFYFDASFGRIAKSLGVDPVSVLSMEQRVDIQERSLDVYLKEIQDIPRPFVCDRTPLDMVAYLLGEVTMHNVTGETKLIERISDLTDRCVEEAGFNFDTIILVRSLDFYQETTNRPPPNTAYQYKTQLIMEGAAQLIRTTTNIGFTQSQDLDERICKACEYFAERITKMQEEAIARKLH